MPCAIANLLDSPEQNGPSWLIVDSSDKAGGLAGTDTTDEGFVRFPRNWPLSKPLPPDAIVED